MNHFVFDTLEIKADGKVSSTYVQEHELSLSLTLNSLLRIHAGGKIEVIYIYKSMWTICFHILKMIKKKKFKV
jgi:hypothetical protein